MCDISLLEAMSGWISESRQKYEGQKDKGVMAICRREIEKALKPMMKYALAMTHDQDISCDLVQESVVKALTTSRLPQNVESYRPWLFSILRNCHIDYLRKKKSGMDILEEADTVNRTGCFPIHIEETLINRLTVRGAIQRLSPSFREILALVDVVGFSYSEVASLLEIPAGTVMSRLSRARTELAREIDTSNIHSLPRQNRKFGKGSDK